MTMRLLIFGPQGSGKGTQAKLVCDRYGLVHISTGDIFRDHISRKTELGRKVDEIVKNGELVPDELTNALVEDRLSKEDVDDGYLLDGYPRNLSQADFLDSITEVNGVIYLDVPDDVVVERISARRVCPDCGATYNLKFKPPKREGVCGDCGGELVQRADDRPAAIRDRLQTYHSTTERVIDHYSDSMVVNVDGTGSIGEVFDQVAAGLDALFPGE